jgi:hypothetical protein
VFDPQKPHHLWMRFEDNFGYMIFIFLPLHSAVKQLKSAWNSKKVYEVSYQPIDSESEHIRPPSVTSRTE